MAEPTTKRASKKAIAAFCEANNLTDTKVIDVLHSLYPNVFIESDEIAPIIIKALFKQYDVITDDDIITCIKALESANKFYNYKYETIELMKKEQVLRAFLEKIIKDVKFGDVRASQYPEWNQEMKDFIKAAYGHWSIYDRNGKLSFAKALNNFFNYWYFERENPPFHCYTTKNGDVLFTKQRHQWIESKGCYDFENNSGCMVVVLVVVISLIALL